ncbi:hypothetical protein FS842_003172 [Serendipita sp. 407]|nr:hypothetical protein FS842_003172 [Serendipita sp. 407]
MSDNKRKHPNKQSGSRKRYKSDGTRISSTTIHGPGVFITCVKGKERQAGKEIKEVFEAISDELWPRNASAVDSPEARDNPGDDNSDDEDDEDDDIENLILKERAKLQADSERKNNASTSAGKMKHRIVIHYTDTPCILFAGCASPIEPVQLTLAYLDEVKRTGIARTRAVQRLEPISGTCMAALPELLVLGEKILREKLGDGDSESGRTYTVSTKRCDLTAPHLPDVIFQYKILSRIRNNSKLTSAKVIEELPKKVPPCHKVSLTNPDMMILVVAFKSVAGIGVAPRYEELRKYNVTQLVEARDLDLEQGTDSRMKKLQAKEPPEQTAAPTD